MRSSGASAHVTISERDPNAARGHKPVSPSDSDATAPCPSGYPSVVRAVHHPLPDFSVFPIRRSLRCLRQHHSLERVAAFLDALDWLFPVSQFVSESFYLSLRRSYHSIDQMFHQRLLRLVLIRFEHPVISALQIGKHCIFSLTIQEDRLNWNYGAWDDCSQFVWHTAWIGEIGNDESRHIRQRAHCPG